MTTARPQACPHCAAPLDDDPRFTVWCQACEWNLVPEHEAAEEATKDARTVARERAAAERTGRLFEEVAEGRAAITRRDWLGAAAIAAGVHLVTAALAGWGIWLLVVGNIPLRCLGAGVLALAFLLRPRVGRAPRDSAVLSREEAPALYGLVDRVAGELGAPPVDVIRVDEDYNASMGVVGLRRTSVLTLGLPLWEVLDDRARVAMLGHEVAHRINGDHRRGLWMGTAIHALLRWYDMATPQPRAVEPTGFRLLFLIADHLSAAFLRVLAWLLLRVLLLLDRLTARAGQQAEYHADELAARAGSTEGARGMLTAFLFADAVTTVALRLRARINHRPRSNRQSRTDRRDQAPATPDTDAFWEQLREHLAATPPLERERLLRRSRAEGRAADATHPPTHLRLALLDRRPSVPAAVTMTPAESAAIAAELAGRRTRLARAVLAD